MVKFYARCILQQLEKKKKQNERKIAVPFPQRKQLFPLETLFSVLIY